MLESVLVVASEDVDQTKRSKLFTVFRRVVRFNRQTYIYEDAVNRAN